ncbi:PleD family two-component system response regulator [Pedobacter sp. SYP-B3415]|uniref:response regulator n=1 Tax=Pedobacter sp. SYP-B3415 TaxID=2496641 RepID=UPI00101C8C75|nr:response regulator [Pedobacter sp. SYP-B3415]
MMQESPVSNDLEKLSVLVVEDDSSLRDVYESVFLIKNIQANIYESVSDICQTAQMHQPSVVILDFAMRTGHGGLLCGQLKSNPLTAHLPVIVISAFDAEQVKKYAPDADLILNKPIDFEDLTSSILQLVRQNQLP